MVAEMLWMGFKCHREAQMMWGLRRLAFGTNPRIVEKLQFLQGSVASQKKILKEEKWSCHSRIRIVECDRGEKEKDEEDDDGERRE